MNRREEMDNGCDEGASNTASVFCVQVLKMRQNKFLQNIPLVK